MTLGEDGKTYRLTSGTEFYAFGGVLGLGPDADEVYEGWDGSMGESLGRGDFVWTEGMLPDEDRREIAEEMIRRWRQWGRLP